jgi:SAM-dependent methyltransferase
MFQTPFRERGADYYDRIYAEGYSSAAYQPVYDAVLDFVARMPVPRVLEVGCGTAELAAQIVAQGIPYRGFDISSVAVERGRRRGVSELFVASAYDPASYLPRDYNLILALEVLEHLEDRRAAAQFPAGTHVLFSVPDFVETSHLRAYQDPQRDIVEHFRGLLTVGQVLPFRFHSPAGVTLTIYLAHAVAGAGPCTNPLGK